MSAWKGWKNFWNFLLRSVLIQPSVLINKLSVCYLPDYTCFSKFVYAQIITRMCLNGWNIVRVRARLSDFKFSPWLHRNQFSTVNKICVVFFCLSGHHQQYVEKKCLKIKFASGEEFEKKDGKVSPSTLKTLSNPNQFNNPEKRRLTEW